MTRLGYQIPNFTYPGVAPDAIFANVVQQAKTAEANGFDRVLLMDHFYQLPGLGDPHDYMLECYTTLAALAQHTETVRLSALVTGNTYRNPAILAKTITALDLVSGGRATLGIGSGWFELEHDAFGIPFNTFTERFEKLEEALNIILPMLRGERPTLDGKHYQVTDAINSSVWALPSSGNSFFPPPRMSGSIISRYSSTRSWLIKDLATLGLPMTWTSPPS